MKHVLLSFILTFFAFGTFASNKICIGEKIIVVLNENTKKLTVHNKETMEVLQSTELEASSFGELALSSDGTKIWFQAGGFMYCRDLETGEILKELQGVNSYKFELSSARDYLIHYETGEQHSLIYVYDLNTTEAISYAKVDFNRSLETIHYDHKKQELHLLSRTFPSKTEKPSKEPTFGIPETAEQIALDFRHDEEETQYFVYDIANKKAVYDEVIEYSSDFECNFEVINDKLFIITDMGTAEVLEDYSLKLTALVAINMADYMIIESELIGVTGYDFFTYSVETGAYTEKDEDEANQILIEADAFAMDETDIYSIKDGMFYQFKRDDPLNAIFDMPLD